MRKTVRGAVVGLVGVAAALVRADVAFAATITTPNTNAFHVSADSNHNPLPFTIVATGYVPGSLVSVEQCDGKSPSAPGWSPTVDCDLGSAPAAAIADANGQVTFNANDPNRAFTPFKGESPQGLFNCLASGQTLNNGLPSYTNCQIRVTSNVTVPTFDQAFLTLSLPK